jgi:nitrite reductase/ring-hydroxylating ferredoxin subunit
VSILASWIKACTKDQVGNNEMFSFDHKEKRLLITNLNGTIYATDRICTHAEADLSSGFLSDEGVRCPLHLSVFNLENGKPLNPPAEGPLKTYNVKIDQNEIYVEV